MFPDELTARVHELYASLGFKPPSRQFTILAAFILTHYTLDLDSLQPARIISLATGTKCLSILKLPEKGDALHDSHAEVLARRGAVRWLLEEIQRDSNKTSPWIIKQSNGKYALREGVEVNMYVSSIPCGDASTRYLASFQDPVMATLKASTDWLTLPHTSVYRGRDNYSLNGVLRTKPGRADSPPTLSMSCSDKVARWNFLGIQGALLGDLLSPVYVSNIIIGEVPLDMQDKIKSDCERAFYGRLDSLEGTPPSYSLHRPLVVFTSIPFIHSRISLTTKEAPGSCNESVCWIADSPQPKYEVIVNGLRRGVPPKHRFKEKFRPQLSKISLYNLYIQTRSILSLPPTSVPAYFAAKQASAEYQTAKAALLGERAPFEGWVRSGEKWESFDVRGEIIIQGPEEAG